MGLTKAQMVQKLLIAIGQDENDSTKQTEALLLLNQSYWDLIDRFSFREKEKTATFVTEVGVRNYSMPEPFEALQSLSLVDLNSGLHKGLEKMDPSTYEDSFNESVDQYGEPERYVRENCFARLWPTPDNVYTIVIKYWTTLDDLSDSQNPQIPQSWHEIILYGGIWRGFFEAGDIEKSTSVRQHTELLISSRIPTEAKEEKDTRYSALQPHNYRSGIRLGRGLPRGRNGFDEF